MKTEKEKEADYYDEMINKFSTVRRFELMEARCRALEARIEKLERFVAGFVSARGGA